MKHCIQSDRQKKSVNLQINKTLPAVRRFSAEGVFCAFMGSNSQSVAEEKYETDIVQGKLKSVWIIEPRVFGDNRGFFMETCSKREFEAHGLFYDFVQDNHSASTVRGTLRGIHFQRGDKSQAKLVRCVRGAAADVGSVACRDA